MMITSIVHERNKGWILDRIGREVGDQVIYWPSPLPETSHYFITHYSMVPEILQQVNPALSKLSVLFTHEKPGLSGYVESLNLCHSIICESPEGVERLTTLGVNPELLQFVPEGGDNVAFQPHEGTQDGSVLICGSFYERKNPEVLLDVIRNSKRNFLLVGKGWDERFSHLSNLTYLENLDYSEYPDSYAKCSVYLSASLLEGGGPNSLIEAMHSNLFPVVSDTGNARQYIHQGYNGLIFQIGESAEAINKLIEKAYRSNPKLVPPYQDIWETVKDYTWANYATQVKESILGVPDVQDSCL